MEDVNVYNDTTITEGSAAVGLRLAGDVTEVTMPAKTLTITTPSNETAPSHPISATTPAPTVATHTDQIEATGSEPEYPSAVRPDESEQGEKDSKMGQTPFERTLKTKRSLREGKSQSLILLTGLEPEDKDRTHKKVSGHKYTSIYKCICDTQ